MIMILASNIPAGELERGNNFAMINSLPSDLLVDVLARVASSSFTDLFNSKLCCRDFRGAAEEECVLEQVSMVGFPVIHQWLKSEKVSWFLNQCVQIGNPEALYRQGMVEYFSSMRMESGLEKLRRASEKGHAEASYVYGIILVCMGGQSSVEGLKLLNAMKGSTTSQSTRFAIFQDCRKRIEAVIRTMWINNHLAGRQRRSCCHENTSRLKQTWEGRSQVEDDASCESCKWDREVSLFCDMLR
ncbi:hypothetical protein RHGRI_034212 [Rhododendron griersonianum]|uniref:At2g35280-like TPR domain-containing protein n=1 Tax=Rhododendron griersonianum TaxID=479676 RepID=A0AAV6I2X3_9ERIC|nr:hypothetical protein RHGRI_034212 [Rhododendron griersonianum]